MQKPMWSPSDARVARSNVTAFMRALESGRGLALTNYRQLYDWSVSRPETFWESVWDFTGIVAEMRGDTVLADGDDMMAARFFPDARLNFAENLLRHRGDAPAVIFRREDGLRRTLTYDQLHDLVARLIGALRALGIDVGDRVAAILPNMPEALAFMLATTAIGGVWSSCSPDFGPEGIVDRIGQIAPKALIAVDGYYYNGKRHDLTATLSQVCRRLRSIEKVVIVPYVSATSAKTDLPAAVALDELLAGIPGGAISFRRFPFDQPAFVFFTSGTTGLPKCIVHAAGRALIKLFEEQWLQFDVKRGDIFFYFTTTGWNMWYTLVTALGPGGTILMYDGSPFYPTPDALFRIAADERIAIFGTSPKYLDALRKAGVRPCGGFDLSALDTVVSTGAPLAPESFDFVYEAIKPDVRLSSISGGTELVATFANGNPIGPVWRGEMQALTLGMKVEVFDDAGRSVRGEKGELVCTAPFPSRPLGFWNDPGNQLYFKTYFSRYPNVWHHGDYAELTENDGLIIYGRSDATLNPSGVRIGTAEIYRAVEDLDEVADSAVVGQEWNGDTRVLLFVKLRDGFALDEALAEKIKSRIRRYATPRHVPAKIVEVTDIPYTVNGKKMELAIANVIHGRPVKNLGAAANPGALDQFRNRAELTA
ncbi:MAG: acetoacetate--CoA ligase [Rhodospirillales bacterium]|nr:acetoacetate--CoA ligase [Rhodospirillales bacterium]